MRFFSSTFFKNFASLSIVNVANNILPLLTVPYVTRIIGPERYGLMNFSHALIGYFVLLINYGFDLSASKRVAANRDKKEELDKIFSETLQVKIGLFILTTIIFLFVITLNPSLKENRVLHCLTYLSTIGHVAYPTWFFQGMERLSRTAVINLVIKLLFTILIFILIRKPNDFIYQNLSISIAHTIGGITALYIAIKEFNLRIHIAPIKECLVAIKDGFVTFYYTVTSTLYTATNIIILQITSSSASVGYFTAGYRIEAIIRTFIIVAFGQSIYPIAARLFEKNQEEALKLIKTILPVVATIAILIGLVLFCFADIIVYALFGQAFQETILVIRFIAVMPLFVSLNYILGVLTLMNLNYRRQFVFITTVGSLIGLVVNFFLSSKYQHIGTSISWISTEGVILMMQLLFLNKRKISLFGGYQQIKIDWNIFISRTIK